PARRYHLVVSGISLSPGVSRGSFLDTFDMLEDCLNAPEAATSNDHGLLALCRGKGRIDRRVGNLYGGSGCIAGQRADDAGYREKRKDKSGHINLLISSSVAVVGPTSLQIHRGNPSPSPC